MCQFDNEKIRQISKRRAIKLVRVWQIGVCTNLLEPLFYSTAWKVEHKADYKPTRQGYHGLHGYHSAKQISGPRIRELWQTRRLREYAVGTFEGYGQCAIGDDGARCEFGRIVCVTVSKNIWEPRLQILRKSYPGVRFRKSRVW